MVSLFILYSTRALALISCIVTVPFPGGWARRQQGRLYLNEATDQTGIKASISYGRDGQINQKQPIQHEIFSSVVIILLFHSFSFLVRNRMSSITTRVIFDAAPARHGTADFLMLAQITVLCLFLHQTSNVILQHIDIRQIV